MSKYLYGFRLYFLDSFNYRFNAVVQTIFSNLRLLIIIFFWILIYDWDAQKVLNGFTLSGIITYLIIMDVFGSLIYGLRSSGFKYSDMIKSGSLGPALLKPQSLSMHIYFRNVADGITSVLPQVILVICVAPFISNYFVWDFSINNMVSIFFFLIVGTISTHLLCSLLGYMAFWLEEANAIMWSFVVLFNMLTGFFLPLDFFPKWSIPILEMLPLASWGYIQTKLFIGLYTVEKQILLFMVQVIWVGILLLFNLLIWQKGVKKFSSVGG
ncbi:MAG: ABC-2 family transporter protein [Oscillospiraceae bacterium]|jgi:ABC-2 type transport system permease protein|nr:ABC-2 family transporter protein [Oscillospiraceae bacterium]